MQTQQKKLLSMNQIQHKIFNTIENVNISQCLTFTTIFISSIYRFSYVQSSVQEIQSFIIFTKTIIYNTDIMHQKTCVFMIGIAIKGFQQIAHSRMFNISLIIMMYLNLLNTNRRVLLYYNVQSKSILLLFRITKSGFAIRS